MSNPTPTALPTTFTPGQTVGPLTITADIGWHRGRSHWRCRKCNSEVVLQAHALRHSPECPHCGATA